MSLFSALLTVSVLLPLLAPLLRQRKRTRSKQKHAHDTGETPILCSTNAPSCLYAFLAL
ncbi:hypothetical protein EXIGLDRAFT_153896 [Exidia glandulosa HHB12029]|uniref:Uncharacterized protein n=1 Tax=Exidia glandulosa HHB12029 TaxID=1314781 RepID=A0A165QH46_EXIGL|nr:hypothetical protein EXIGLDRAFT_153896 [Exidia glandulosa HHB12029]